MASIQINVSQQSTWFNYCLYEVLLKNQKYSQIYFNISYLTSSAETKTNKISRYDNNHRILTNNYPEECGAEIWWGVWWRIWIFVYSQVCKKKVWFERINRLLNRTDVLNLKLLWLICWSRQDKILLFKLRTQRKLKVNINQSRQGSLLQSWNCSI